jgi:hypothetical protein
MQVWEAPLVICLSTFVPVLRLGFCDSNYFISICAIISLLINREKLAGQVSVAASLGVLRDFSMVGVEIVRACAIARRTRDLPHLPHQNRDFSAHTSMRYSKQLNY